jgi:hypothetical protein
MRSLVMLSCTIACAVSGLAAAQDATPLPSRADAEKVLNASNLKAAAGITRIAITSCNVLFGTETRAVSETQAGFGEPTAGRVDARVDATYALQGMDATAMQELTDAICADAGASYAAAGYEVVPQAEVNAHPDFARLQGQGKPVPYAFERDGSKYTVMAPAGQQVFDPVYLNNRDSLGAVFKAIGGATSGTNYMAAEGALLKSLNASGVHVNVMVDFAKAKANKVSGFLGRMAGSSEAKVEAKMQLSVSGFVVVNPLDAIECYNGGVCMVGTQEKRIARFTTKAPIVAGENAVVAVRDIQSKGEKAGEAGLAVLTGLMALGGTSTTSTSIERNGVEVNPTLYATEVRGMAGRLVGMAAALTKS